MCRVIAILKERDIRTKIFSVKQCRPKLPTIRNLFSNKLDRKNANLPLGTAAVLTLLEQLGLLPRCCSLAR